VRKLAWHSSFRRAFKRLQRDDRELAARALDAIEELARDPFQEQLRTHKLRGALEGLWAAWVEYDCRLVFAFEPDAAGGPDVIALVDIGSHDEVY
jgi:addiction module RelE/StbE family toxin